LDGCFFKGACQGELLAAIGRDANNQMYPVAWAVVEKETNESWAWFIGLLIKDLDINDQGAGWVFISDKQKGLINSMRDYLPKVEHRMCARHIYANWRKKHKDHQLQKRFWAIAKSANREDFNYNKAKLAQLTPEGAKDIMKTDPKHWARAFFPKGANCESGLPCCHAICAIYKSGRKVEDFIDKCYYIDTFKKKYEHCLQPVEGEESWPMSQNPRPVAPGYIAMPGARKKNNDRKREEGEAPKGKKLSKHGIQITCGSCGGQGHNKTSCKKKGDNAKKRKSYLGKRGRKVRETEQAQTDASTSKAAAARASGPTRSQVAARSQSAARSQAAPSQVAASSQATTSRFIPPRSSSTTNNDVPRGSTTAVRGRGNGRGSVGGTGRGRGSETGFMAFFTASGNY
uniref:MULE transposase domain-containing protein n=1 Tax=Aegilops tauschii subsp. strangulata TaxID=200361 RepID=A0A453RIB9_AEGTS